MFGEAQAVIWGAWPRNAPRGAERDSRRCLHATQGIVVLVIFETAVNAASMGKFFSKKRSTLCLKDPKRV